VGTVVLADTEELITVKISELPKLLEVSDEDVIPTLHKAAMITKGAEKENLTKNIKIDGGSF
jgi:hypothetical protein